jgi:CRP-like cAMP-binding protein
MGSFRIPKAGTFRPVAARESKRGEWMSGKVLGVFKAATDTRDVPAGSVIFEAGSVGEEMYGVVEGKVELRLSDGRAVAVGPDETFGEMALVDASARSATAVAVENSKLAVIDKRRFLFLVHETPTFALQVMSTMAERLRAVQA